jgi:predicted membrane-bound mannosyltransferase
MTRKPTRDRLEGSVIYGTGIFIASIILYSMFPSVLLGWICTIAIAPLAITIVVGAFYTVLAGIGEIAGIFKK